MDDESLTENMSKYAFLDYAALYWGTYVKQQCDDCLELAKMIVDHGIECPPYAIQALYKHLYKHLYPRIDIAQKFSGIHAIAYSGLSEIMAYFCQVGRNMELKDDRNRTPLS